MLLFRNTYTTWSSNTANISSLQDNTQVCNITTGVFNKILNSIVVLNSVSRVPYTPQHEYDTSLNLGTEDDPVIVWRAKALGLFDQAWQHNKVSQKPFWYKVGDIAESGEDNESSEYDRYNAAEDGGNVADENVGNFEYGDDDNISSQAVDDGDTDDSEDVDGYDTSDEESDSSEDVEVKDNDSEGCDREERDAGVIDTDGSVIGRDPHLVPPYKWAVKRFDNAIIFKKSEPEDSTSIKSELPNKYLNMYHSYLQVPDTQRIVSDNISSATDLIIDQDPFTILQRDMSADLMYRLDNRNTARNLILKRSKKNSSSILCLKNYMTKRNSTKMLTGYSPIVNSPAVTTGVVQGSLDSTSRDISIRKLKESKFVSAYNSDSVDEIADDDSSIINRDDVFDEDDSTNISARYDTDGIITSLYMQCYPVGKKSSKDQEATSKVKINATFIRTAWEYAILDEYDGELPELKPTEVGESNDALEDSVTPITTDNNDGAWSDLADSDILKSDMVSGLDDSTCTDNLEEISDQDLNHDCTLDVGSLIGYLELNNLNRSSNDIMSNEANLSASHGDGSDDDGSFILDDSSREYAHNLFRSRGQNIALDIPEFSNLHLRTGSYELSSDAAVEDTSSLESGLAAHRQQLLARLQCDPIIRSDDFIARLAYVTWFKLPGDVVSNDSLVSKIKTSEILTSGTYQMGSLYDQLGMLLRYTSIIKHIPPYRDASFRDVISRSDSVALALICGYYTRDFVIDVVPVAGLWLLYSHLRSFGKSTATQITCFTASDFFKKLNVYQSVNNGIKSSTNKSSSYKSVPSAPQAAHLKTYNYTSTDKSQITKVIQLLKLSTTRMLHGFAKPSAAHKPLFKKTSPNYKGKISRLVDNFKDPSPQNLESYILSLGKPAPTADEVGLRKESSAADCTNDTPVCDTTAEAIDNLEVVSEDTTYDDNFEHTDVTIEDCKPTICTIGESSESELEVFYSLLNNESITNTTANARGYYSNYYDFEIGAELSTVADSVPNYLIDDSEGQSSIGEAGDLDDSEKLLELELERYEDLMISSINVDNLSSLPLDVTAYDIEEPADSEELSLDIPSVYFGTPKPTLANTAIFNQSRSSGPVGMGSKLVGRGSTFKRPAGYKISRKNLPRGSSKRVICGRSYQIGEYYQLGSFTNVVVEESKQATEPKHLGSGFLDFKIEYSLPDVTSRLQKLLSFTKHKLSLQHLRSSVIRRKRYLGISKLPQPTKYEKRMRWASKHFKCRDYINVKNISVASTRLSLLNKYRSDDQDRTTRFAKTIDSSDFEVFTNAHKSLEFTVSSLLTRLLLQPGKVMQVSDGCRLLLNRIHIPRFERIYLPDAQTPKIYNSLNTGNLLTPTTINCNNWQSLLNQAMFDKLSVRKPQKAKLLEAVKWSKKVLAMSFKGSRKSVSVKHTNQIRYGRSLFNLYFKLLDDLKNDTRLYQSQLSPESFVLMLIRLFVYKEIEQYADFLQSVIQKLGFKQHKQILYLLRSSIIVMTRVGFSQFRFLGLYTRFAGKIMTKGGEKKKTFDFSVGKYGGMNLDSVFRYKHKKIWTRHGSIGLKTILMHKNWR